MHIKHTVLICVFLLLPSLATAADITHRQHSGDETVNFAIELKDAVLRKDIKSLKQLSIVGDNWNSETEKFVYDDAYARRIFGKKARSVASILASPKLSIIYEGSIETGNGDPNREAYVLFYYLPFENNYKEMSVSFLTKTKKWMIDYVACKVERVGTKWSMRDAFCYSETDGP